MYSLVISSLFLGASALTFPRASSNCSFELTASGGQSGTIGSLSDGQNRIGGGLSPVTFTINNGGITNSWGNGCILTPSVEQFQCDSGVGPTYGFSISNNGSLINPSGNSVFYACPASDTEWNLYTTPVVGQLKCVQISLAASACYGSSSGASSGSKTASSIQAIGTTSSASFAQSVGISPSSSSPEVVTVTVYNCGLASSASFSLSAGTSPVVGETQTIVPQASTSEVSAIGKSSSQAYTAPKASSEATTKSTTPLVGESATSPVGQSSTQAYTAPKASSKVSSSVVSVGTTTKSTIPIVGGSTTTPVGISTEVTSTVKSAIETSSSSPPIGQTITATIVPVESTTPAISKTTTLASVSSPIQSTTVASTSKGITTEFVYATTTVCPVTLTHTTGGTTSLETTSSISTVWITSTSIVCTACEHLSTSSAKISGPTSTSPAESSYIQSISSASTPGATVVPSPTTLSTISSYSVPSGGYNASTTPLASGTGVTTKTTTSAAASGTSSGSSTCVSTALTGSYTNGNYQYPHLIIPVSEETPDTAAGTQYFGTISENTSTIFNFDVPSTYSGHTCNLIFLLPLQSELETSSYTFSGAGTIDFEQLSTAATSTTTYNNAPSVEADLGTFTLTEGSSTLIKQFDCSAYAGTTYTAEMKAVGDTYLYYFQDWNPSPLGIYITVC